MINSEENVESEMGTSFIKWERINNGRVTKSRIAEDGQGHFRELNKDESSTSLATNPTEEKDTVKNPSMQTQKKTAGALICGSGSRGVKKHEVAMIPTEFFIFQSLSREDHNLDTSAKENGACCHDVNNSKVIRDSANPQKCSPKSAQKRKQTYHGLRPSSLSIRALPREIAFTSLSSSSLSSMSHDSNNSVPQKVATTCIQDIETENALLIQAKSKKLMDLVDQIIYEYRPERETQTMLPLPLDLYHIHENRSSSAVTKN